MKIFIVEDDEWYGNFLSYHLSMNPDHDVKLFTSAEGVLKNLDQRPDIITLDYNLPDSNGAELMIRIKKDLPEVPVVFISGQDDISTAVGLLKAGAFDYVVKNDDAKDHLWHVIQKAKERATLHEEIDHLRTELGQQQVFDKRIIGESKPMKKVNALLQKAASTVINVSITGETGTGKEVAARAIHYNSNRKSKPFVAVNVAAIPKELIESELFGHEKGAFTGASSTRIGKFEEADGGTLFLDEIGEMDIALQAKMLRVLQEKEVVRVGSNTPKKINVRIISATHKNLVKEIREGNFREDLYYRIQGLPIELPPLREREKDIILLAEKFIQEAAKENKTGKKTLSTEAKKKLMNYPFPGNVRELKSVLDLAVVLSDSQVIEENHLMFARMSDDIEMLSTEMTLKEYTLKIIYHFLEKYDQNVLKVAKKLDIGKSTIYRMLKEEEEAA